MLHLGYPQDAQAKAARLLLNLATLRQSALTADTLASSTSANASVDCKKDDNITAKGADFVIV